MKIMVFDVGGTEIKYSVMDEQMHRTDSGAVPTPQDTQAQFLDAVYRLYAPHKDEVTGIESDGTRVAGVSTAAHGKIGAASGDDL